MTDPFVLGSVQQLNNTPESIKEFISKLGEHIQIEARFHSCDKPIEIRIKSFTKIEDGIQIEFFNQDDANLFWSSPGEVNLIFPSLA